mmetsp:Transcript_25484/g.29456  ORF Transcript_25484/g.29456 Transcript_25484/m.29456 type:complete len:102 (+) Transcript_25484:159-464(+)
MVLNEEEIAPEIHVEKCITSTSPKAITDFPTHKINSSPGFWNDVDSVNNESDNEDDVKNNVVADAFYGANIIGEVNEEYPFWRPHQDKKYPDEEEHHEDLI